MIIEKKIEEFKTKLQALYPDEASVIEKFLLSKSYVRSFRITNEKHEKAVIASLKSLDLDPIRINLPQTYTVYDPERKLGFSDPFKNKQIYIQSLSSMLDSFILNPQQNEKILDLCSAPGSKTTHISQLTKNKSAIYAVEPNYQRLNHLKRNCNDYGVDVHEFIQSWGEKLLTAQPQLQDYFDKVLVDAPCSNENAIKLYDQKSFSHWNPKKIRQFAKTQKKLILAGFDALKRGGTMVYSTCTYSFQENEEIVNYLLKNREDAFIKEIPNEFKNLIPNFKRGFVEFGKQKVDSSIQNSIRIFPSEGWSSFYIAHIGKQ